MHLYENFLNTLWEFTRTVQEDRNSFIQKARKVCQTFKVKSMKTHKLDVPAKKTECNLFYKHMRENRES